MWPTSRKSGKPGADFPFEHLRFSPEKKALDDLLHDLGLEPVIRHRLESGDALPFYEMALAQQLRLTELQSPRLYGLLEEVRSSLQFREPTDLFVTENPTINAAALHRPRPDLPHALTLTSHMVEMLTDDELRHVLGHEVGHLAFGHYRMRLVTFEERSEEKKEDKDDSLICRWFRKWDRMAELSADRIGFVAAGSDFRAVVSATFKIVSGLGPEHLQFDLQEYLRQLDDLPRLERREVLHLFSHPVMVLRIWSLKQFHEAGGLNAKTEQLADIDAKIQERLKVMTFEPATELAVNARETLINGALLAIGAGKQQMTEGQHHALVKLLLPLCDDPDEALTEVKDTREAWKRLRAAANWMKENAGEARFSSLRQLFIVLALGERCQAAERLIFKVARLLGIPRPAARELQVEACAVSLRANANGRTSLSVPTFTSARE